MDYMTVLDVAATVMAGAAVVAAALPTPSPKANIVIRIVRGIIDVLAVNLGNAKNKPKA